MDYHKVDPQKLKDLNIDKPGLILFASAVREIELGLYTFNKSVTDNRYLCPSCTLKRYVELSFDWETVIKDVEKFKNAPDELNIYVFESSPHSYWS